MSFQVTDVQKALKGADYPMDGDQLAELAGKNGASEDVVNTLRRVGRADGPNGVMKQLKGDLGGRTPGEHKSEQRTYKDIEGPAFQVNEVQKYLKGADGLPDGRRAAGRARREERGR